MSEMWMESQYIIDMSEDQVNEYDMIYDKDAGLYHIDILTEEGIRIPLIEAMVIFGGWELPLAGVKLILPSKEKAWQAIIGYQINTAGSESDFKVNEIIKGE